RIRHVAGERDRPGESIAMVIRGLGYERLDRTDHLARRIETRDADVRPASQRRPRQVPGPDADIENTARAGLDDRRELIEQAMGARRQDGRPPPVVSGGPLVETTGLRLLLLGRAGHDVILP